jgi:hypothetical protein
MLICLFIVFDSGHRDIEILEGKVALSLDNIKNGLWRRRPQLFDARNFYACGTLVGEPFLETTFCLAFYD